ncbi:hypothetical protein OXX59_010631 [Metschnikowia pulcherrima]
MVKPTSPPNLTPISSETRFATDMAATLLGCVHATSLLVPSLARLLVYPSSAKNCVICVVLPDPVSPTTTTIWFSAITFKSASRAWYAGKDRLCC